MDPLLMSETQYDIALSRGNFNDRNNSLLGISNPIDTNGNLFVLGHNSIESHRRSGSWEGAMSQGDVNLNGSASSLPGLANANRGVSFIEGWSNNMNGSRNMQDAMQVRGRGPGPTGSKRSHRSSSNEDMMTFSPPATPEGDHRAAGAIFTTSFSTQNRVPSPESSMNMCSFNLNPATSNPLTSLVLTAPSPSPGPGPSMSLSAAAVNFHRYNMLVPHQSNSGNPFWFPTPSTARTMRSIEQDGMEPLSNQNHLVPDLRSIASGALVDIEVPSSYAGSAVSITGSQATLLSPSSPFKKGSIRRSISADSLFGGKACYGSGEHSFHSAVPLAVLPGKAHCPSEDNFQLSIKRTTSLDHLRHVTPYPMPPLPCYSMDPKVAEMVRSMSMEERASLALSMDEPICRICWGGIENEEVFQPCYCNTHVHMSCIQRWLGVAKITYCEVCHYQYKAYRKMKPLSEWRWWPNKNRHLAQLEATVILLGVVTPPLLCGIILCSQKITEYLRTPDNAWKTAGLMTLVMVSVGTYLGAILYFCHKFATVCHIWVNSNRTTVVTVVPLTLAERRPKLDPCRVWAIS